MPPRLTISAVGLELIKRFESFSAAPYLCPANKLTIGYGHVILPRDNNPTTITHEQATDLLRADCEIAETYIRAVTKTLSPALNQNEFDALVSLVFNIGVGNFSHSTLLKHLKAGEKALAAEEFKLWNKSGGKALAGLSVRRAAEYMLFLTPQ